MTTTALSVQGISKSFNGPRVLSDVSIDVLAGEVHALVGENGSGKSTLIKILSGFHAPDPGGSIEVAGQELRLGTPEDSRVAGLRFVHQDLGLIDKFTALENFGITSGFPVRRRSIDWPRLRRAAEKTLERVGVTVDLDRPVAELSAVERTGLAIARCLDDSLLGAPRVLVLDEPTAALPVDDVARLFEIVREVASKGVGVIYVSHRLDEVIRLSDRITVIRDGSVIATVETASMERATLADLIVGEELGADEPSVSSRHGDGDPAVLRGYRTDTIQGIDVSVGPGEIVGIAGLDGSGRESFARGLVGDAGGAADEVMVGGRTVTRLSPQEAARAGIALVLANRDVAAAVRDMTIAENITLAGLERVTRHGVIRSRLERPRVDHWISELDIRPPVPSRQYSTLSGGNRQKVIFAKWLNIEPRLLVLDEPTSGVDIGARRPMYSQIRDLAARGIPVLVASSDLEDLTRLCDRIVVLVAGRVAAELTGADITERRLTLEMSGLGVG